ncbi:MAG: hypothetical protein NTV34_06195, partial [Proteobacteria bacterium]|nr:hypothetical protein [Pseudomonadota bacterium]
MGRNIFEKYNAVKRSIGTVSLFLAALPLILGADRSLAQAAQNVAKTIISRKDRLELTDFYTNVVQQKIRSELRLNGINDREGSVALVLEFDEQRLTSDATTWYKSLQDNQVINARKQSFSLRSSIKELIASSRADRIKSKPSESSESSEAIPGGLRLGRLNVDISNSVIAEILTSSNRSIDAGSPTALVAQESPVTLAINIPAENGMTVEPYVFKAADYIKKVSLEIILPAVTPKEVVERLPGSLVSLLDLESMSKGANTKEWIKVALAPALPLPIPEVKPEVIATPKSFAKNIWKPENAFLGTLASGLVIGIFILVSMIVGSKAVSKGINTAVSTLGKDIASLKPADDLA